MIIRKEKIISFNWFEIIESPLAIIGIIALFYRFGFNWTTIFITFCFLLRLDFNK